MVKWQMRILRPVGCDGSDWHDLFNGLASINQDVHYTPDYARIYELTYGQEVYLAAYGNEDDYIIMPFMLRNLTLLPFLQGCDYGDSIFDISNPYGYGGPLVRLRDDRSRLELYQGFFKKFHNYCSNHGVVSEFASLHPLLKNHIPLQDGPWVSLVKRKPIIYINLQKDKDALWKGLSRGNQSSINKSRRLGVEVVREKVSGVPLDDFKRLYMETMARNQATERWLFPDSYFSSCAACLGEDRISLFSAKLDGITIAQYLIIHAHQTVYYHFGGSSKAYFDMRPNNLLMYEVAMWAKDQGYRWFHLGGGYMPDDSLYRFKSGFSKDNAWLYTYGLVHDEARYARLCEMRDDWDLAHGIIKSENDFFPAYRK